MRPNLRKQLPARFYRMKKAADRRVERLKEMGFTAVRVEEWMDSVDGRVYMVAGKPPKGYK